MLAEESAVVCDWVTERLLIKRQVSIRVLFPLPLTVFRTMVHPCTFLKVAVPYHDWSDK